MPVESIEVVVSIAHGPSGGDRRFFEVKDLRTGKSFGAYSDSLQASVRLNEVRIAYEEMYGRAHSELAIAMGLGAICAFVAGVISTIFVMKFL